MTIVENSKAMQDAQKTLMEAKAMRGSDILSIGEHATYSDETGTHTFKDLFIHYYESTLQLRLGMSLKEFDWATDETRSVFDAMLDPYYADDFKKAIASGDVDRQRLLVQNEFVLMAQRLAAIIEMIKGSASLYKVQLHKVRA